VHVQPKYAIDLAEARRVIAEHGWARVITVGAAGLRATYGFFLLEDSEDDEVVVAGHFARADPQSADIEAGTPTLLIFEGPHGFVSASWYRPELTDVPSTMNHISVHLQGTPEPLDGEQRFEVLTRTIERHEGPLGDSRWRLEGGGLELSRRIAPHTIAFRLRAARVEAKAKLSQAMPRPVRERIVERLDAPGPHHHPELAALMRRLSLANTRQ
jgi:transcriptional regulator